MSRIPDRQLFADLMTKHEPLVRDAFLSAIDEIRNAVTLTPLAICLAALL